MQKNDYLEAVSSPQGELIMSVDLSGHGSWMATVLQHMGAKQGKETSERIGMFSEMDDLTAYCLEHMDDDLRKLNSTEGFVSFFSGGKSKPELNFKRAMEKLKDSAAELETKSERLGELSQKLGEVDSSSKEFIKSLNVREDGLPAVRGEDPNPWLTPETTESPKDKR